MPSLSERVMQLPANSYNSLQTKNDLDITMQVDH
jgi:hypothetical protein